MEPLTSQRRPCGGDEHSDDHTHRGHTVPQHTHTNGKCEKRQAALEDHVHGKTETPQRPQGESGLQGGENTHWSKLLHGGKEKRGGGDRERDREGERELWVRRREG